MKTEDFFSKALSLIQANKSFVITTIIKTYGSSPRHEGSKMIICENGEIFGTIGGGSIEYEVIKLAHEKIKNQQNISVHSFDLMDDVEMACGGKMDILFETFLSKPKLFIFGAGHVGTQLAKLAQNLDFDIYLIDNRPIKIDEDLKNIKFINTNFKQAIDTLPFDNNTYICIMTYKHEFDTHVLTLCLDKPNAYIGVIASKSKTSEIKNYLLTQGYNNSVIEKINMPIGVNIKSETPFEIAIAILAKIIDIKNNKQ